jgi:hypothetical protein
MKSAAIGINKNSYFCKNEFSPLKKVITAAPLHMQIEETINETQRYYLKSFLRCTPFLVLRTKK